MQIRKLKVCNYKSFRDSGWLSFSPSFTVIIGQNNVGKTALLEAFKLSGIANFPHRSLARDATEPLDPRSAVQVELEVGGKELARIMLSSGHHADVPVPRGQDNAVKIQFARDLLESEKIKQRLLIFSGGPFAATQYPSHGAFERIENPAMVRAQPAPDKQKLLFEQVSDSDSDTLPNIVQLGFERSIYVFRAERLNIGRTPAAGTTILLLNGSNLAVVLMALQSNAYRFERFNKHVTEIFPNITRVVVVPVGSEFEIRIWSVDIATEREDLAIPLSESGTGVGQVLAILYVAMTLESGLIVIDEPGTFLHPGAAKKLIQILRQYDTHQYVIATHSGDLIATADPDVLHLVTWSNGQSAVEELDRGRVDDLRRMLIEVGASFSDVFGFDRVVWVEGPTEEACFPMILRKLKGNTPLGAVFVAVKHIGDFERKGNQKKLIWDIYERLSSGFALLPTAVTFSFDREARTDQQIVDLKRESRGRVHFLPRLTYENYLLHADAIAAVLTAIPREGQSAVAIDTIESWLKENGRKFASLDKWSGDLQDIDWLTKVHSPNLLKALFDELSGVNLEYLKTTHSILLTEWLLDHRPDTLSELAAYIDQLTPPNVP